MVFDKSIIFQLYLSSLKLLKLPLPTTYGVIFSILVRPQIKLFVMELKMIELVCFAKKNVIS